MSLPEPLAAALAEVPHRAVEQADGMPTVAVEREHLHAALEALRDRAGCECPTLVTAVDQRDVARPGEPRFQVVHQLLSIQHRHRVRLLTGVTEDDARVPTCTDLWPGVAYFERECYDMFGIGFDGHEGLKRLLMPDGYGHHPLRKDFPHEGIEPDRLYREWDTARRVDWKDEA
jgi:NADH:ubiquinone oxidoreductase subunit C